MKLKSIVLFSFLSLFLLLPSVLVAQAYTDPNLEATVNNTGAVKGTLRSFTDIEGGAASVIGTILSFVGVAFLLLMIYGGILWMISQGNDTQIKKAKDIIINGVIGLVIVVFAYAITSYLGNGLTTSQTPAAPVNQTPVEAPASTPYVPYGGAAN